MNWNICSPKPKLLCARENGKYSSQISCYATDKLYWIGSTAAKKRKMREIYSMHFTINTNASDALSCMLSSAAAIPH